MLKSTALLEEHKKLGGRLVDFGGWELPVQYTGLQAEHLACRQKAGLFDVSHMGEFIVEGPDAETFLNALITNDLSKVEIGQAQYTVMCLPSGGIVDDLIIYKRSQDRFLLVVNASNTEKDFQHVLDFAKTIQKGAAQLKIEDQSRQWSQIAVQGPKAFEIVQALTTHDLKPVGTYRFIEGALKSGISCIFARTGYTGEDGFELYMAWDEGPRVWQALLEKGKPLGLTPCGLGARDTLRLEMKYPLYGHELTDSTSPLEAGLGWVVKLAKPSFVGKAALVAEKEAGLKRKLVGLRPLDRGIPRQGYTIWDADQTRQIGEITSGTHSPSLDQPIGVAYVETPHSAIGTRVKIAIRDRFIPAEIVNTPFYKRPY